MSATGRARQAVYQAQDWTPVLRAVDVMPDGQAEIFELADAMYPPPRRGRSRGPSGASAPAWFCQPAVMRVWADLVEAGLVEIIIPADGIHGDLFTVSEAGHRWLAEHDTLVGG